MKRLGILGAAAVLCAWTLGLADRPVRVSPVTDALIERPDPGDWLHWRRTLDGWAHSPLDQINARNAAQLQLAWGWQLAPGTSEAWAARARRGHVRSAGIRPGRRPRRRHGHPPMGVRAEVRAQSRHQPGQPAAVAGDLRHHGDRRRAQRTPGRARCRHRQGGLGPHRRGRQARLPIHERSHRRRRARSSPA